MALTPKMQMFVEEYLVDLNATQAAIRAGYSAKTANRIAAENMSKPVIKAEIEKRMKERGEQIDINAKWVLERLVELTNRCMQAEPVLDREGNETGEYRFDSAGANKALDSIGKHLGMFKERMELSGGLDNTTQSLDSMSPEERRARIDELNRRRGAGAAPTAGA